MRTRLIHSHHTSQNGVAIVGTQSLRRGSRQSACVVINHKGRRQFAGAEEVVSRRAKEVVSWRAEEVVSLLACLCSDIKPQRKSSVRGCQGSRQSACQGSRQLACRGSCQSVLYEVCPSVHMHVCALLPSTYILSSLLKILWISHNFPLIANALVILLLPHGDSSIDYNC